MFTPETLDVVMVSFEGPDQYSQAGGLGVRARELCRAFAALGFRTTLVFVGDPDKPGVEIDQGVQLVRWCQQISDRYRNGVYEGELAKIRDLTATLPDALIDSIIRPAAEAGGHRGALRGVAHGLVLQVAERPPLHPRAAPERSAALECQQPLRLRGDRLAGARLRRLDHDGQQVHEAPHVAVRREPGGHSQRHPRERACPGRRAAARAIRAAAGTPCLAFKIGRFSPDKRWNQAVAALAELRSEGLPARMLMRGGMEPYGATVLAFAAECGLAVTDWYEPVEDAGGIVRALTETDGAPIVHLRRFLPDQVITEINVGATAVLANSGHEPFGLVGLEAMAAGGVAMVGATGEEYARPYGNAIVVETDDPAEIASALRGLVEQPALGERLRVAARWTPPTSPGRSSSPGCWSVCASCACTSGWCSRPADHLRRA